MTLLVGAIGWGLLVVGGVTHAWHFDRLRMLLARHLDHELPAAVSLVATELVLAAALALTVITATSLVVPVAIIALVLGIGFASWIARLLLTGSALPCACSFSEGPTSVWSLVRAAAICLVGLCALALPEAVGDRLVALAVGLGVAAALFVLPEALSWPTAQRAQLARIEGHQPINRGQP